MDVGTGGADGGCPPAHLEGHVSVNLPSDYDDIEPNARLTRELKALSAAWSQLPPPAKLLAWAGALSLAAPALRSAAKNLGIEPLELLQLAQLT
jgi:hypothetical protein